MTINKDFAPERKPSTRADCEKLFRKVLDEAEANGDPNNFPVIFQEIDFGFRGLRRNWRLGAGPSE